MIEKEITAKDVPALEEDRAKEWLYYYKHKRLKCENDLEYYKFMNRHLQIHMNKIWEAKRASKRRRPELPN